MAAQGPGGAAGGQSGPSSSSGPPYAPEAQLLGSIPKVLPDIPICAVFCFFFLLGAIAHVSIFIINKKQAHKFLLSNAFTAFCVIRVATTAIRIVWATDNSSVAVGIAAQILVFAGTIIPFIINLVFTQRIIRAQHPRWGWHKTVDIGFGLLAGSIVATILMLIAFTILSFYTLETKWHRIARDIQLYGSTYYVFIASLPIPLVIIGIIIPKRVRVEKFGIGRFRTKIGVLLTSSTILTIAATWRCATNWLDPVPPSQPSPWYFDKAFFYVFNLGVELFVAWLYVFVRIDRRFHIPNGARGPGSYKKVSDDREKGKDLDVEEQPLTPQNDEGWTLRVYSEEELFDDTSTLAETLRYNSTSLSLDRKSGKWMLRRESRESLYSRFSSNPDNEYMYSANPPAYSDVYSPSRMYSSSRASRSSDVHSSLEPSRSLKAPAQAFNPDDVNWEKISMAKAHAPSLRSSSADTLYSIPAKRDTKRETWDTMAIREERPQEEYFDKHRPRSLSRPKSAGYYSRAGMRAESPPPPMPAMPHYNPYDWQRKSQEIGDSADHREPSVEEARAEAEAMLSAPLPDESPDRSSSAPGRTASNKWALAASFAARRKSTWRRNVESEMKLDTDDIADEKAPLADLDEFDVEKEAYNEGEMPLNLALDGEDELDARRLARDKDLDI